ETHTVSLHDALPISKAKLDFPDPERPVMTTSLFLGMATSKFFKLWSLAPLIIMLCFGSICCIADMLINKIAKIQYGSFNIQYAGDRKSTRLNSSHVK